MSPTASPKGNLRVFLSYAPGAGHTQSMLCAGAQAKDRGVNVAVGALAAEHRAGCRLELLSESSDELDLDGALRERPALLLVDNLAHTNPPGARHEKRYQDVQELLNAGIDVYATLGVYHLESLGDLIVQMTGEEPAESIPDSVLESADQIVFFDLTPDELIKGFRAPPGCAVPAGFYKTEVLIALRELGLRKTAARVEQDLQRFRRANALDQVIAAADRLLVCVGPSPLSQSLVRATKRLADSLDAPWIALHVDHQDISASQRESVHRNLEAARRLGGEVREVTAPFTPETLVRFAQEENVTKIVLGKPAARGWPGWMSGSLVDRLVEHSSGLDVIVVGTHQTPQDRLRDPTVAHSRPMVNFVWATLLVAAATGVGKSLPKEFDLTNVTMLYLAAVVCISYFLGKAPALWAGVVAVAGFNFLFIPPTLTFSVAHPQYIGTFLGFFLVGWLVADLTERSKIAAAGALRREKQAVTLFALQRDLLQAASFEDVNRIAHRKLQALFGNAHVLPATPEALASAGLAGGDLDAAEWVAKNGRSAGRYSKTLPDAGLAWHPIFGTSRVEAVVGLQDPIAEQERFELFQAVLSQLSAAFERVELAKTAAESELLRATEKLQKALLNSVSHDLRIPLVSINGTLSSLLAEELTLTPQARREMTENALSEAERLTQLVTNLLQMSKMEAGQLPINAVPCDLWDLVSTTVAGFLRRPGSPEIRLEGEDDIPLVTVDYVLIQQVLYNLLENAARHGAGEVTIALESDPGSVTVTVSDEGEPIAEEQAERIFERFYRPRDLSDGGSGLGLSICKGLVEAHGGKIRLEGGKKFRFTLPLAAQATDSSSRRDGKEGGQ